MSPEDLLDHVKKKYDVICFEPLSDYNQDAAKIYQLFDRLHRPHYDSHQRLVFWSSDSPSKNLIKHILKAADTIDISSCFIMICGPVADCDYKGIEILDRSICAPAMQADNLIETSSFCPLPFMHLQIGAQGSVRPCCVNKQTVGSIVDHSLSDLFSGADMKDLRLQFLDGRKPDSCSHCWDLEAKGLSSNRLWNVDIYKKRMFVEDWINRPTIRSLDISPSNVCNFKCRVCSPGSSSLYAAEVMKHEEDEQTRRFVGNIVAQSKTVDDNPQFLTEMQELLADIIEIEFYGGEPFLVKQLKKLLQQAVDNNHAGHIRLHFNTNGSIWPDDIIDLLIKFQSVDISISIDDIERRFEIQRGGSWPDVNKNVQRFQDLGKPFTVSVMPTVNIQNVYYLPELLSWADQLGLPVLFNYLDAPEYLNIDQMTEEAKKLIVDRFSACDHQELINIKQRVEQSQGSDGKEFCRQMNKFDLRRGQDFHMAHKEIANAMGYVLE